MIHALTVDVEDYPSVVAREWLGQERPPGKQVVENTRRLLELFARHGVRGTFFVLGDVAEAYPQLVRDIRDRGHELGVHGFYHRQVFHLTAATFREEVSAAKSVVEGIIGDRVAGHRAPAFSIMPSTSWALDVLAEAGFLYDSSVFPIAGRRYGWPGFKTGIQRVNVGNGRSIIEVPMSIVRILGRAVPVCGGGYLRHFPLAFTRWAMRNIQRYRPAIVYLHPCEIEVTRDPFDTGGYAGPALSRLRRFHFLQLRNRHTVARKLENLLSTFRFAPLREVIDRALAENQGEAASL